MKDLPIVCVGNDYTKRCGANDLTRAGRSLLRRAKVSEKLYYQAYRKSLAESKENTDHAGIVRKKDPTAYLFRRNGGSHLVAVNLPNDRIEYIMGHKIESSGMLRNDFVNPDILTEIKNKMEYRPYFGSLTMKNEIKP